MIRSQGHLSQGQVLACQLQLVMSLYLQFFQAILWAISCRVDVIFLDVNVCEPLPELYEAVESAIANDIVCVLDPKAFQNFGSAACYRFLGDKSTEDIIRFTGGGIKSHYSLAFMSGMTSLFISRYFQVHKRNSPNGKRRAVKEWLDGLARGGGGGDIFPWSIQIVEERTVEEDGYQLVAVVL